LPRSVPAQKGSTPVAVAAVVAETVAATGASAVGTAANG